MRIFLTGVSGYLGSVLADHLAAIPEVDSITGIDIAVPKGKLPDKVHFLQMDIRSPEVAGAVAGHDVLVHTAFIVLWPKRIPERLRDDINLNGIRNVAKAALTNHVGHFIHLSSVAAYNPLPDCFNVTEEHPLGKGDSFFYYSNGKALAERTLMEVLGPADIKVTILRPSFVVGPKNRDTVPSLRRLTVKIPGLEPSVQYIHEDDVASSVLLAIQKQLTGAYNVVPDDCIPMSEVGKLVGLKHMRVVPFWLAESMTALQWNYFGSLVHRSWVKVTYSDSSFSNAKLRSAGWQPRYNSREALLSAINT